MYIIEYLNNKGVLSTIRCNSTKGVARITASIIRCGYKGYKVTDLTKWCG